ncbi:helix-turn-helix domain-containing protein [Metabacillus idriensis]|uniref:helix-turn-helix domain-containing protein n=1 Tax=Metabacillus idriensis TaxID=324768 RepID=UPI00174D654B|nr:helix-turn-helix domain-containing protein [Metabacillus idriensis]MCM3599030.1 helix-turn-helix domain-containing protein [Metabacillus idriensis]
MSKSIEVIANEDSFKNLSSFNNIEELNRTVRAYKDLIKTAVKRSDVKVKLIALLELLKRHSCKQIGVSYMCKNTIAKKLEVSYKTVQRLMKKLEKLSMISQVAMKRKKDMLQTANAIIINPIEEVSDKTPSEESEKCPTNKTTSLSLKQKINNKRNSVHHQNNVDNSFSLSNFIAHWVPENFAKLTSSFYSNTEVIQEFWKVVKQCNRVVDYSTYERAFSPEQELHIGMKAFKEYVMKVKSGTNMIKGKFAYFNGIVNKLMDKYFFERDFIDN